MTINFRPLLTDDLNDIHIMMENAWNYSSLFEEESMGQAYRDIFLSEVLNKSSYSQIAEVDGQVVGAVFGRVDSETPSQRLFHKNPADIIKNIFDGSTADQKTLHKYIDQIDKSYTRLMDGRDKEYNGSIELFIVSKKAQGKGVGSKLLDSLLKTFREQGANKIYLYTDTDCSYQFYDYKGFNRVSEFTLKNEEFTFFIYDKEI